MDEQAEYSILLKAAYDYFYGGDALAQSELQDYGLSDHRIDESLSDGNAVVITHPDGLTVVRGTDLVIWRPIFKSPWVIITTSCCNLRGGGSTPETFGRQTVFNSYFQLYTLGDDLSITVLRYLRGVSRLNH